MEYNYQSLDGTSKTTKSDSPNEESDKSTSDELFFNYNTSTRKRNLECRDKNTKDNDQDLNSLCFDERSVIRTKHAVYRNVISYNIDTFKDGNDQMIFSGPKRIKMETPVAMLMAHDEPPYDVFLPSDEDDFKESKGKTKIISVKEFVLKRRIIP